MAQQALMQSLSPQALERAIADCKCSAAQTRTFQGSAQYLTGANPSMPLDTRELGLRLFANYMHDTLVFGVFTQIETDHPDRGMMSATMGHGLPLIEGLSEELHIVYATHECLPSAVRFELWRRVGARLIRRVRDERKDRTKEGAAARAQERVEETMRAVDLSGHE